MKTPRIPERGAVAALLLAALAATGCSQAEGNGTGPKQGELKKRELARVRVEPVRKREMVRTLQTTTVVESENEVEIFPRASGIVTQIFAEEGDFVAEGKELARLDDREALAMLEQARVAVTQARDAIERSKILEREAEARIEQSRLEHEQAARDFERNEKAALISQQALDALRTTRDTRASDRQSAELGLERARADAKSAATALEKAELDLRHAELELSYTRIVAPFDGLVARRGVRIGGTVGRGTSVIETAGAAFVLTDPEHLRAVFHRPQRELSWFLAQPAPSNGAGVEAARPVEIRVLAEAHPGHEFQGTIQRISPSIDPQSGSFRVTVGLSPVASAVRDGEGARPSRPASAGDAADPAAPALPRLLPGMLVRLEIVTDRHPGALVVPKRALRREGEIAYLFVVRDGRARRIEVEEGFVDDEAVEISPTEGASVAEGEPVVVVGNRELEEDSEVVVDEGTAGADGAAERPEEAAAPSDSKG